MGKEMLHCGSNASVTVENLETSTANLYVHCNIAALHKGVSR